MDGKTSLLIILFGSTATGKAGRLSDVDIAISMNRPLTLKEKNEIAEAVSNKLNVSEERIDLVDLINASPLLQYQVANTGKLLEGDPFDFLRFKVLAWKRYLDTAKFRRLRKNRLEQFIYGN